MKYLPILILCFALTGCAGVYKQKRYDPATGNLIMLTEIKKSAGEYDGFNFYMDEKGNISVNATNVRHGLENIGKAIDSVIENLEMIKAGMAAGV